MKKIYVIFFLLQLSFSDSFSQVVIPYSGGGPKGSGSLLVFESGGSSPAIQENWGLNICGEGIRPVKIYNSSLLLGYVSSGENFGVNNAFISGNVGIGTTDSKGYKLAVKGNIHTQEINVDMQNWADYVFKPDYKLLPLSELKAYIDKNKHLPDLPSEREVIDNGVNLGEMNKLLTKKVEELTLYLIAKDSQLREAEEKQQLALKQQSVINQQLQEQLLKIQNQLKGLNK